LLPSHPSRAFLLIFFPTSKKRRIPVSGSFPPPEGAFYQPHRPFSALINFRYPFPSSFSVPVFTVGCRCLFCLRGPAPASARAHQFFSATKQLCPLQLFSFLTLIPLSIGVGRLSKTSYKLPSVNSIRTSPRRERLHEISITLAVGRTEVKSFVKNDALFLQRFPRAWTFLTVPPFPQLSP